MTLHIFNKQLNVILIALTIEQALCADVTAVVVFILYLLSFVLPYLTDIQTKLTPLEEYHFTFQFYFLIARHFLMYSYINKRAV